MLIAIDGTAGSGKSTVAKSLASRLHLTHIDTGATYRVVGLQALRGNIDLDDAPNCAKLAKAVCARMSLSDGVLHYKDVAVGEEIRNSEIAEATSKIAVHPELRAELVKLQRRLVPVGGAVVEGRDIATVVWPTADVKLWLDAEHDARSQRRSESDAAAVASRDQRDQTRTVSPMIAAPDSIRVDTTNLSAPEVVAHIIALLHPAEPPPLYKAIRAVMKFVLRFGYRLRIKQIANAPRFGSGIISPNHRSLLDIFIAASATNRQVFFMAKGELFRHRMAANALRKLGAFPVNRGAPDRTALATAMHLLERGELVCVFPEGTRTKTANFDNVLDGVAWLALKTGARIVPIGIKGAEDARLLKSSIRANIGLPFALGGPSHGMLSKLAVREATLTLRLTLKQTLEST